MAEISVIVPVYKVESYICRCVDSILAQTFTDFELILVDDGSPDNCGMICDEYAAKDPRVHVIHQENGGLSAARNAGIDWAFANSDSEWLTFIDSDDWVHPQYLECLFTALVDYNAKISMGPLKNVEAYCFDSEVENCFSRCVTPSEAYIYNTRNIASYACGRLFHKETCFSSIRFPVGRLWEDLSTTYKILWKVSAIALVEEPLYYYFRNPEGIVLSKWTPKKLDELLAYEEQIPFFKEKGEKEIYSRLVRAYTSYISLHVKRIDSSELSGNQKKKYHRLLRRKMRRAIRQYGREFGITIASRPDFYEIAYPRLMELYWLLKVCENKLKRK